MLKNPVCVDATSIYNSMLNKEERAVWQIDLVEASALDGLHLFTNMFQIILWVDKETKILV